jgi:hypothetical protein
VEVIDRFGVAQGAMRKTIYLLNIDNYAPEITALTYPLIERYARKIGAALHVIRDRKWPEYAPVYEKLQIYDLAREHDDDWSIYIDSDALVHPDMFDVTDHLSMDTVAHNGADMAGNRWRYDEYFRRDGRHIGSCNWLTFASRWCVDLWRQPDDLTYEQALENIFPTQIELSTIIQREHLIDDYILSRNIARFGLKFTTVADIQRRMNDAGNYFWHQYTLTTHEKIVGMQQVLTDWRVG